MHVWDIAHLCFYFKFTFIYLFIYPKKACPLPCNHLISEHNNLDFGDLHDLMTPNNVTKSLPLSLFPSEKYLLATYQSQALFWITPFKT